MTETQFSTDIPEKPKGLTDNEWVLVQQSRTAKEYSKRGGWILFVGNGNKKKKHAADSDEKEMISKAEEARGHGQAKIGG